MHGQDEARVTMRRGPNQLMCEKSVDELCIGVKCQSNLELAGSPRKALRHRVGISLWGVEH